MRFARCTFHNVDPPSLHVEEVHGERLVIPSLLDAVSDFERLLAGRDARQTWHATVPGEGAVRLDWSTGSEGNFGIIAPATAAGEELMPEVFTVLDGRDAAHDRRNFVALCGAYMDAALDPEVPEISNALYEWVIGQQAPPMIYAVRVADRATPRMHLLDCVECCFGLAYLCHRGLFSFENSLVKMSRRLSALADAIRSTPPAPDASPAHE